MTLPDIPRLYTALAEVFAVLVYAQAAPPRAAKPVTYAVTAGWAAVLGVFLQLTGSVPLTWWLPCMVTAIAWLYLYLWGTREMNLLEAGYSCARAADYHTGSDADGCRHGGHGVCGQQSELYLRQRCHDERDEHFLHPHAGGFRGRADPDRPA